MIRTLLETITERATNSFGRSVNAENFDEWHQHWLTVGEAWHAELLAEGLTETAAAVQKHIDFERKWVKI